jgi:hypothetical protein
MIHALTMYRFGTIIYHSAVWLDKDLAGANIHQGEILMKKKILSLALILSLVLSLVPFTHSTEAVASLEAGSIPISNRAELQRIGNDRDYPLDGKYHLTNDIDLTGVAWTPIGNRSFIINPDGDFVDSFRGVFDGRGHIIRNLTVMKATGFWDNLYAGLFGFASKNAIIHNIGMENITIDINHGEVRGGGLLTSGDGTIYLYAGGITGYGGNISNSFVTGSISITVNAWHTPQAFAGGISGANANINNCYSIASVSASSNYGQYESTRRAYAGGIVGFSDDGHSIANCYSNASVTVINQAIPPVGVADFYYDNKNVLAGGIAGYGVAGNSFWNISSRQTVNGAILSNDNKKGLGHGVGQVTALTSEQMRQQSSFAGWDFSSVWGFKPGVNDGYPVLRAFHEFPSNWAETHINQAILLTLVPRTLQSRYTQAATRAEFCALAVALFETVTGRVITERMTFTDTDDVNVQKMGALGVVQGVGSNRFDPNARLTREQAAVMLSRLADAIGQPLPREAASFADNDRIASWAIQQVGHVQAAGIMGGIGSNTFAPQDPYTREQSIVTMLRLFHAVNRTG